MKGLANIKSALKRIKVANFKTRRNRIIVSSLKTSIRRFNQALAAGDAQAAEAAYTKAVSTVDKAAGKGVIHKNAANRKKSRLALKLTAAN